MPKWQDEIQNSFIKRQTFRRIYKIRFSYWVRSSSDHLMGLPTGEFDPKDLPRWSNA